MREQHGPRRGIWRRVVAATATFALVPQVTTGCDPGNPVGDLLNELEDTVDEAAAGAARAGNILTVTAGGQVGLAIDNFASAFATELDDGINTVDDDVRARLDQIDNMVEDLQTGNAELLVGVIDGAQQLVNSLPFTNRNPQVRAYTPTVTASSRGDVHVVVSGNFYWASHEGTAVSLSADGQQFTAAGNTTTRLDFVVPAAFFASSADAVTYKTLTLTAPYEDGSIFNDEIVPGVFNLLVTVLPTAPIRELTLTNRVVTAGEERRSITQPPGASTLGGGWRVNAWEDCDDEIDSHTFAASGGGWSIDTATVKIDYSARGVASRSWAQVDTVSPTAFVVSGHALEHCYAGISSDSGDVTYFVTYDEVRPTETQADVQTAVPLRWGDEVDLPVTRGSWSVHAVLWDGSEHTWRATDDDNPYVQITEEGDSVHIEAPLPDLVSAA